MNRMIERLLIAGLLLLSAAFAAKAQKAPRALQISAENLNAHTPRHADLSRVLPGDTVRYHLLFTNVSAGAVHGIDETCKAFGRAIARARREKSERLVTP